MTRLADETSTLACVLCKATGLRARADAECLLFAGASAGRRGSGACQWRRCGQAEAAAAARRLPHAPCVQHDS